MGRSEGRGGIRSMWSCINIVGTHGVSSMSRMAHTWVPFSMNLLQTAHAGQCMEHGMQRTGMLCSSHVTAYRDDHNPYLMVVPYEDRHIVIM